MAAVYRVQDDKLIAVKESDGVSSLKAGRDIRRLEADYTRGWYAAISQDIWGSKA